MWSTLFNIAFIQNHALTRKIAGFTSAFWCCRRGQVALEYILVISVVAAALAACLDVLHGSLATYFDGLAVRVGSPYP